MRRANASSSINQDQKTQRAIADTFIIGSPCRLANTSRGSRGSGGKSGSSQLGRRAICQPGERRHDGPQCRFGLGPRNDDDVNALGKLRSRQPKRLAEQPLPPVALDGSAHLARHRNPQARMLQRVFTYINQQQRVGCRAAAAVNPVEISAAAQAMLARESLGFHAGVCHGSCVCRVSAARPRGSQQRGCSFPSWEFRGSIAGLSYRVAVVVLAVHGRRIQFLPIPVVVARNGRTRRKGV